MGYITEIMSYDLQFQSEEAKEKWEENEKKLEQYEEKGYNDFALNMFYCPLTSNSMVEKLQIFLSDHAGKWSYEMEYWIPFLAQYVQGYIECQGDEPDDLWKVSFDGKGGYEFYEGQISWFDSEYLNQKIVEASA